MNLPEPIRQAVGNTSPIASEDDPHTRIQGRVRPRSERMALGSSLWQYTCAVLIVFAGILIGSILEQFTNYQSIAIFLLLVVLVSSLILDRGPMLLTAILSAILWEFFFIEPRFTVQILLVQDYLMLGLYFMVAVVIGTLTGRLSSRERAIRQREERTNALYALTADLSRATTIDDVVKTAVQQISDVFNAKVAVYLLDDAGQLVRTAHPMSTLKLPGDEFHVVASVYKAGSPAGRFTSLFPDSRAQHFPLRAPGRPVGVVSIRTASDHPLLPDLESLLNAFDSQIALAVERELLDRASRRAEVLEASDRLYSTLLSSISHEVRSPLAAISGAANGLMDPTISADPAVRQVLGQDIQDATARLNRLIGNLLEMTRLQADRLVLNLQWTDLSDLIDASVRHMEKDFRDHLLTLDIPIDLPLIRVDFVLMEHALTNLLHNAAMYTPPGSRVSITARIDGQTLLLTVSDNGPGLPENGAHVFEKFYRGPGVPAGGTGLGLSIVRGLVEAHQGTIQASNLETGGATFVIRLPLEALPDVIQEME